VEILNKIGLSDLTVVLYNKFILKVIFRNLFLEFLLNEFRN